MGNGCKNKKRKAAVINFVFRKISYRSKRYKLYLQTSARLIAALFLLVGARFYASAFNSHLFTFRSFLY
ncbi:hypothetical protein DWS23_18400 [Escherichia coli]|nr:hypothetical protein C1192_05355 [Escherichia marmotae]EEV6995067.1 hypothetical protein [Escherichia coli]PSS39331.1 hypothetical protein BEM40_017475 [Escherichia sp. MOD1-EC5451]PSY64121.1 hypothetical protein C7B16_16695 [Escherichia sp. 20412-1]EFN9757181.1 hypothetical protein [Escherichia coli]